MHVLKMAADVLLRHLSFIAVNKILLDTRFDKFIPHCVKNDPIVGSAEIDLKRPCDVLWCLPFRGMASSFQANENSDNWRRSKISSMKIISPSAKHNGRFVNSLHSTNHILQCAYCFSQFGHNYTPLSFAWIFIRVYFNLHPMTRIKQTRKQLHL